MCGDVGSPRACSHGATTSSGETFDPARATAALAAPFRLYLQGSTVYLKLVGPYPCRKIRLNDKMHPRYIGVRGFDLSPGAVRSLTGRAPRRDWSGRVDVCWVE